MKHKRILLLLSCAVLVIVSCERVSFTPDKDLIYGKWASGSTYYRFDRSYQSYMLFDSTYVQVNGTRWNTADDVTEGDQWFRWTLDGAALTLEHQMYMGGVSPKSYTVTALNSSSMTWEDSYGNRTTFTKQ